MLRSLHLSLQILPASIFSAELQSHAFPSWEGNPFAPPQSASYIFLTETCRSVADKAQRWNGKFPELLPKSITSPWCQVCSAVSGQEAAAALAARLHPIFLSASICVTSSPAPFSWGCSLCMVGIVGSCKEESSWLGYANGKWRLETVVKVPVVNRRRDGCGMKCRTSCSGGGRDFQLSLWRVNCCFLLVPGFLRPSAAVCMSWHSSNSPMAFYGFVCSVLVNHPHLVSKKKPKFFLIVLSYPVLRPHLQRLRTSLLPVMWR